MEGGVAVIAGSAVLGASLALFVAGSADPAALLREMHPDCAKYVLSVRTVSLHEASVSPEGIYSGLVRPGGADPRLAEDAPRSGKGVRNDIVIFPSPDEGRRGLAWWRLILDHEYFHARHLARGWRTPLVDFGDAETNHHYYEATAWGYVLGRALAGVYGDLRPADVREARAAWVRHAEAFRRFVLDRQPSAWAHFRRFVDVKSEPEGAGAISLPASPATSPSLSADPD